MVSERRGAVIDVVRIGVRLEDGFLPPIVLPDNYAVGYDEIEAKLGYLREHVGPHSIIGTFRSGEVLIHRNPPRRADEFDLDVPFSRFPFPPQAIRSAFVEIYIDEVMPDALEEYLRDSNRLPFELRPKGPNRNREFFGVVDSDTIEKDDDTVSMSGRDFTALLIDNICPPGVLEQIDLNQPLHEAVQQIVNTCAAANGMQVYWRGAQGDEPAASMSSAVDWRTVIERQRVKFPYPVFDFDIETSELLMQARQSGPYEGLDAPYNDFAKSDRGDTIRDVEPYATTLTKKPPTRLVVDVETRSSVLEPTAFAGRYLERTSEFPGRLPIDLYEETVFTARRELISPIRFEYRTVEVPKYENVVDVRRSFKNPDDYPWGEPSVGLSPGGDIVRDVVEVTELVAHRRVVSRKVPYLPIAEEASYWDVITDLCVGLGCVNSVEDQELFIEPARTVFGGAEEESKRIHFLEYDNCDHIRFTKDLGRTQINRVVVHCWDTTHGVLLEGVYPTDVNPAKHSRVKPGKAPKTPKRQRFPWSQKDVYRTVSGFTSQESIDRVAEARWFELRKNKTDGTLSTADLYDRDGRRMLGIRGGALVDIGPPLGLEAVGDVRFMDDDKAISGLLSLGVSPRHAVTLLEAVRSGVSTTYWVREPSIHVWDSGEGGSEAGGFELELDYVELPTLQPERPDPNTGAGGGRAPAPLIVRASRGGRT